MPRNGAGSYSLPQPPFVPGTTISSSAVNSDLSDIASALTSSIAADGQTSITAAIKFFAGTAALPGVTFSSDTTSGLYLVGTGKIGVAVNATATVLFDGTAANGNYLQYVNTAIIQPVGVIHDFAGSTAPTGWLLCYGQAVSRTTYANLFAVIGTTYGVGDGSTTFNLPDLRGRYSPGKDDMGGVAANRITVAGGNFDGTVLGQTGGQQNRTIAQANLPNVTFAVTITDPGHTHTFGTTNLLGGGANVVQAGAGVNSVTTSSTTGITASAASGGSGTALATLPGTIILNKIIFAGTP